MVVMDQVVMQVVDLTQDAEQMDLTQDPEQKSLTAEQCAALALSTPYEGVTQQDILHEVDKKTAQKMHEARITNAFLVTMKERPAFQSLIQDIFQNSAAFTRVQNTRSVQKFGMVSTQDIPPRTSIAFFCSDIEIVYPEEDTRTNPQNTPYTLTSEMRRPRDREVKKIILNPISFMQKSEDNSICAKSLGSAYRWNHRCRYPNCTFEVLNIYMKDVDPSAVLRNNPTLQVLYIKTHGQQVNKGTALTANYGDGYANLDRDQLHCEEVERCTCPDCTPLEENKRSWLAKHDRVIG